MTSATNPPLALWTTPRSVSTAFERMIMERGDFTVLHEPFSEHYYYGPGKRSDRYEAIRPHATPTRILEAIDDAGTERRVFLKDMASHVRDLVDPGFVARFQHTFLVRDPAWALPSLEAKWPDFTEEEAGYTALAELVDAVDAAGEQPVIIDSLDVRSDPRGTIGAYCAAVGIPFVPDALEWSPGMPGGWELWEDWHHDVAASDGFRPRAPGPPPEPGPRARAVYDACRGVYDRLWPRRVRAAATQDQRFEGNGS